MTNNIVTQSSVTRHTAPHSPPQRPQALPVLDPEFSRLLAHLHRGGDFGYWWSRNPRTDKSRTAWYSAGTVAPVPSLPGWDIYYGVHPTAARGETWHRASQGVREIAAVNCLYVEIDGKDYADDEERFKADPAYRDTCKARALEHIRALPVPPSVIIDSSGGYHCYWLLDKPFIVDSPEDRDHIASIQARWVSMVGGDDGAKDLYRVLRVPGTVNHKYPDAPTVSFLESTGALYSIEELAALLPPEPAPAPVAPAVTTTAKRREELSERGAKRRATYVEKALNEELEKLAAAPAGAGNNTLFKVTARCYEFVASGDVGDSEIERAIEQAAAAYVARDGKQKFTASFHSGRRSGLASPATFPDFDDDDEPQIERFKVLTGGDGATSELERYQQLTATFWNIITTDADGWDANAKVLAAYGALVLFRQGADVVAISGGAATVATRVGMSKTTVGTHADRLQEAGLWQWHKGEPVLCDKQRQPVNGARIDPTRTPQAQGMHFENNESVLYLLPLPTDSLPPLPRTKRQETQKQREEEKRQNAALDRHEVLALRETLEKLEAARCPHCAAQGTLGAHCNDCGAIVAAEELAVQTLIAPDAASDPVQSLNAIKLGPNFGRIRRATHHDGKQESGEPAVCVQTLNAPPPPPPPDWYDDDPDAPPPDWYVSPMGEPGKVRHGGPSPERAAGAQIFAPASPPPHCGHAVKPHRYRRPVRGAIIEPRFNRHHPRAVKPHTSRRPVRAGSARNAGTWPATRRDEHRPDDRR